jgi:hypothetical protein
MAHVCERYFAQIFTLKPMWKCQQKHVDVYVRVCMHRSSSWFNPVVTMATGSD